MSWLLLVAHARAEDAPFVWSLRVDGTPVDARTGPVAVHVPGWTCGLVIEPSEVASDGVAQAGVVGCDGPKGLRAETFVLCVVQAPRTTDNGAGNLVLATGAATASLELGCTSPGLVPRPRLQLEPGATGALGIPTTRTPRTPGTLRWSVGSEVLHPVDAPGPVAAEAPGWTCAQEVSGVQDPTYGYSEYGTVTCRAGDASAATVVPCVRASSEAHTCQAGNLAVGGRRGRDALLMVCADVGNPGCGAFQP